MAEKDRCPNCGEPVERQVKFCSNCGQDLREWTGVSEVSRVARVQEELREAKNNNNWSGATSGVGFGLGIAGILFGDIFPGWFIFAAFSWGIVFLVLCVHFSRRVVRLKNKL